MALILLATIAQWGQPMSNQNSPVGKVIRRKELEERIAKSCSWIYSVMDPRSRYYDPSFPLPIRMSQKSIAWVESEVDSWIISKMQERTVSHKE